jgi:hypothetical protein
MVECFARLYDGNSTTPVVCEILYSHGSPKSAGSFLGFVVSVMPVFLVHKMRKSCSHGYGGFVEKYKTKPTFTIKLEMCEPSQGSS